MPIPTEPIGSIPRPSQLLSAVADHSSGHISDEQLRAAQSEALRETIARLEETGSPVITDGEHSKPSFATYPLAGVGKLAPDGVVIPFAEGHTRQLPRLSSGPFRYGTHAVYFLKTAQEYAHRP
jgi:5-methyltetrahydropteroyltriglutamate--homocysteine methyltransferase